MDKKEELQNRFTYHPPKDDEQVKIYQGLRNMGLVLASMISEFCPESRETLLALTKVEEAVMWANAAIARNS